MIVVSQQGIVTNLEWWTNIATNDEEHQVLLTHFPEVEDGEAPFEVEMFTLAQLRSTDDTDELFSEINRALRLGMPSFDIPHWESTRDTGNPSEEPDELPG